MNDGGPAFPFTCQGPTTAPEIYYGMTLRDYFAGQAIIGIINNQDTLQRASEVLGIPTDQIAATGAYEVADAMLLARTKNLTPKSTTE